MDSDYLLELKVFQDKTVAEPLRMWKKMNEIQSNNSNKMKLIENYELGCELTPVLCVGN